MTKDLTDQAILEIVEVIKQTKDFAKEQAPLVATEMLRWGMVKYVVSAGCFLTASVFCFLFYMAAVKEHKNKPDAEYAVLCLIFCLLTISLIVGTVFMAMAAIQVHVAPRLYLLETLNHMARQH